MNENNSIVFDTPNNNSVQNSPIPNSNVEGPSQPIINSPVVEVAQNYSHWYTRAAAYLIDIVLINFAIGIISAILLGILFLLGAPEILGTILGFILALVGIFSYFSYFLSKEGSTPGLKFLGIKIVREDGTNLSFGKVILRTFIFFIVSLINIIMILVTQKKQGLHDLATGSVCLPIDEKTSRAKWILGGYCGCSILGILIPIVLGVGTILSNPKTVQQMMGNPTVIQEKPNFEDSNFNNNFEFENESPSTYKEMNEEPKTTDILEEKKETNSTIKPTPVTGVGSEFYKACMQANPNPNIDLSDYCVCAEDVYMTSQDLNMVINRCKDKIIMN